MRIISRKRLREFAKQHSDAATPLDDWYRIVTREDWNSPHDVKAQFGNASFIGGTETVFNIGGNKYRLVVNIRYDLKRVYIMHVFTHAEYTAWSRGRQ